MKNQQTQICEFLFIREFLQDKSETEIEAAQENYRRYLSLIRKICVRLDQDEVEREGKIYNEVLHSMPLFAWEREE
jgi:hypothetical protein